MMKSPTPAPWRQVEPPSMVTDEMIHGSLPRSGGSRQQQRFRSVRGANRPHQRPEPLPLPERQHWGAWDIDARLYTQMQERLREAGETYRPPWRTRIEDEIGRA